MTRKLELKHFRDLDIRDPFFDSLKEGYGGFEHWFESKKDEEVYIVSSGNKLNGMIYLKTEDGPIKDVEPHLENGRWLKVGTLKIVPKGTRLGERVLKKILDTAIAREAIGVYVTVFEVHKKLIDLFKSYGFVEHGTKNTEDGIELVLKRSLVHFENSITKDYPYIHISGKRYWLLAIYPDYHTRLLPDSILNGESEEIIKDVSPTNSIHKVYISGLSLQRMAPGDVIIFYRTTDRPGKAYYRSVITSMCVVEEVKRKKDFKDIDDYINYTLPRSVFSESELRHLYAKERQLVFSRP